MKSSQRPRRTRVVSSFLLVRGGAILGLGDGLACENAALEDGAVESALSAMAIAAGAEDNGYGGSGGHGVVHIGK
jgi:hypothetical protein